MGKYKNVTDFTDIVRYCERELDIPWNQACDVVDNLRPQYEVSIYEYHIDEFKEGGEFYEDDKEAAEIMYSYMNSRKIKNISIIDE